MTDGPHPFLDVHMATELGYVRLFSFGWFGVLVGVFFFSFFLFFCFV